MTAPVDPFPDFAAGQLADANQVDARFKALYDALNGTVPGSLELVTFSAALKQALGIGPAARGKSIISTAESRTNTAYGLLPTPDLVNVTLPTDGLIFVQYQAIVQESTTQASTVQLFLGANQVVAPNYNNNTPTASQTAGATALTGQSANRDYLVMTSPAGLIGAHPGAPSGSYTNNVTTGQILGMQAAGNSGYAAQGISGGVALPAGIYGGVTAIFAAAGTYDVSVRFKASAGSVTARSRNLWVWTEAF